MRPMTDYKKPKSIANLEDRMGSLSPDSLRYRVLESAKDFKSSWIELGQYLYTVYKDKTYKDWGYLTFEAYCAKEIGVRQNTAIKLLKGYSFLEKEEPEWVRPDYREQKKPDQIPSYEAVNSLRLAKQNDRISESQYEEIRDEVLEDVKEDAEVKKKIKYILKTGPKPAGASATDEKMNSLKKLTQYLQNFRNGVSTLEIPSKIMKQLDEFLEVLEDYQK